MVDARDRRAALQVEALQLRVELAHLVEEREREAERVAHVQGAPDARVLAVDARGRAAARGEIGRERVEVVLAAHPEREAPEARDGPLAQDERVVQPLLPAAQVERARRALAHEQPEQVDVEVLGGGEVEHGELGPGGPDDVVGRAARAAPRRARRRRSPSPAQSSPSPILGMWCEPSATCTISISQ